MGIKHFFSWLKKKYPRNTIKVYKDETMTEINKRLAEEKIEPVEIDDLLLDMNGIFHTAAQKVYEYGNFKAIKPLLTAQNEVKFNDAVKRKECFEKVCETVDKVLNIVKPKKRLIMCVDGTAPLSKQTQQRQRRFVSAKDSERNFDSNCITPGTLFMDYLSRYIDFHIKKSMSDKNSYWSKIDVIFSNEKAPGEGEHKLLNYIRMHGYPTDSYCMYGADADLIMLGLSTQIKKFYILRDEQISQNFEYYFVPLGEFRQNVLKEMCWKSKEHKFSVNNAIYDFVMICFMVGNDFLPHLPSIEIIEGGIEYLMGTYKNVCKNHGHITKIDTKNKKATFNPEALGVFLEHLSRLEKKILQTKLAHKEEFFKDEILENHSKINGDEIEVNIKAYRKEYYEKHFPEIAVEKVCHEYLEGVQWVLQYYIFGVPDWRWKYPYHYAPFAYTIAKNMKTYELREFKESEPFLPFIQLLSVLPPKSSKLIPFPLSSILHTDPFRKSCPENFEIDLSGKRQEWEGIAILPFIDVREITELYRKKIYEVEGKHRKRNIIGKSFFYTNTSGKSYLYSSYYGEFMCNVQSFSFDM